MAAPSRDRGIASLAARAIWARVLIVIFIIAQLLLALGFAFILWQEIAIGVGFRHVLLASLGTLLGGLPFLASALAVSLWVHRAHSNLAERGIDDMSASPGWATASYYVPLVNLFVPMKTMRELVNRSNGEDVWQAQAAVGDVSSWWSCLIAGCLIQGWLLLAWAFNVLTNLEMLQPPGVNPGLALLSILLLVGSAVFLFRIIGTVTRAQQSMTGVEQAFA